jgi:hypothetical protein
VGHSSGRREEDHRILTDWDHADPVCQTLPQIVGRLVISAGDHRRGPAPLGRPFPLVPAPTVPAARAPTDRRPTVVRRDRTALTVRTTSS